MRHNIKKGDAMNNEEQYILNALRKAEPFHGARRLFR